MKVDADRSRCEGHGMCAAVAPEVYALDDDAVVVIRVEPIPADLEAQAGRGADACPVAALMVTE